MKTYRVSARSREPLLDFMRSALQAAGCRIIFSSPANEAPFRITFETPLGERMGILAYAFLANSKPTRNRPLDEYRFQMKYSSKQPGTPQELWQDPFGLYTTILLGISPEEGFFVGADPELHNPTRFFISIEFKRRHVEEALRNGWHVWERDVIGSRPGTSTESPVEVLVAGTPASFLSYIRFEREATGEDQGHRQELAERALLPISAGGLVTITSEPTVSAERLHALAKEFQLSETEILDVIATARRLHMAVRGWVAETHLERALRGLPRVEECRRIDAEGSPDLELRLGKGRPIYIECKNVLRPTAAGNVIRLDFQRTRASKSDPCTRYYRTSDFDVVAACLHAVTQRWEYRYALTSGLDPHAKCPGRLASNVRLDQRWSEDALQILSAVSA